MYLNNLPVHLDHPVWRQKCFGVEPFMFLSVKIKNDWRTGTSVVDLVISVCIKYNIILVNFYKWNIYVLCTWYIIDGRLFRQ